MKIAEILEKVKPKTEKDLYKITFYKVEGDSVWWRAYEWSAYLTQLLPYDDILTPTRKHSKELDTDYVFTGLPFESFQKFFPDGYNDYITDKEITIIFKPEKCKFDIEKFTLENHETILNKWKSSVKQQNDVAKTSKKEKDKKIVNKVNYNDIPYIDNGYTVFSIMNEIISYPLLNKTPIDNLNFISELQKHVSIVIGNGK